MTWLKLVMSNNFMNKLKISH